MVEIVAEAEKAPRTEAVALWQGKLPPVHRAKVPTATASVIDLIQEFIR
ncbi:hypothetical protein [Streptomyces massasporeus]